MMDIIWFIIVASRQTTHVSITADDDGGDNGPMEGKRGLESCGRGMRGKWGEDTEADETERDGESGGAGWGRVEKGSLSEGEGWKGCGW